MTDNAEKWEKAMKMVKEAYSLLGSIDLADIEWNTPANEMAFEDTLDALGEFVGESKGYNPFTAKEGPPEPTGVKG